jgi:hypothetical protein
VLAIQEGMLMGLHLRAFKLFLDTNASFTPNRRGELALARLLESEL